MKEKKRNKTKDSAVMIIFLIMVAVVVFAKLTGGNTKEETDPNLQRAVRTMDAELDSWTGNGEYTVIDKSDIEVFNEDDPKILRVRIGLLEQMNENLTDGVMSTESRRKNISEIDSLKRILDRGMDPDKNEFKRKVRLLDQDKNVHILWQSTDANGRMYKELHGQRTLQEGGLSKAKLDSLKSKF